MPRLSAPLVLLPAWLVMVACSPHSLRIGKCGPAMWHAPNHCSKEPQATSVCCPRLAGGCQDPALCLLSLAGTEMGVEKAEVVVLGRQEVDSSDLVDLLTPW